MAPSSSGKWVSRAAATGGGRTYRGQVPVNWYAGLVVIVLLGLFSIVFARYEYQHHHTTPAIQPAVGTTLYAAYAIDVCGTVEKPLAASTNSAVAGITTPGEGVINVSPHVAAQAGNNATLEQLFSDYPGAALSTTKLKVPKVGTFKNGEKCPAGTPDAGKKGAVLGESWPNEASTTGTVLASPGTFKITARSLVTVGFVPKTTTKLPRPSQSTINEMLGLSSTVVGGTTTTTTVPTSTTTTAAGTSTTTTTAPTGTTTTSG
jgi:hypothetical protein